MTKKKILKAILVATMATSLIACSKSDNDNSKTDATTTASKISASKQITGTVIKINNTATNSTKTKGDTKANSTAKAQDTSGKTKDATTTTVAKIKAAKITASKKVTDNAKIISDASYTIGYSTGSSLAQDSSLKTYGIDNTKVLKGFEDAIEAKKPALSQQEISQSMSNLRATLAKQANSQTISNFLKIKDSIYNSDLTPKSAVRNPAVVLYEFFDYQCIFCSKIAPEIEQLMKNNKDVQVAFVDFPIFGERWAASTYAAEVGVAIYKLNGAAAYVKYHNGIFATGDDEGKLTNSTIENVAKDAGANLDKVKAEIKKDKLANHMKNNISNYTQSLGIQGTPFMVVAPAKNANKDNISIINGFTDYSTLENAVKKAKA